MRNRRSGGARQERSASSQKRAAALAANQADEGAAREESSRAAKRSAGKAWAGRFREATDASVDAFTTSLATDLRMAAQDIRGSIAHARGLGRAGLLSATETRTLVRGLEQVGEDIAAGKLHVLPSDEDVHMAVERELTALVGPVGGKLHTGRSRNDQVATDLRLWLRDEIDLLSTRLRRLIRALLERARKDIDVVMPGYTHLQRAQPVLLSHHWLAYVEMLRRDLDRLADCRKRTNVMPLGAGALAGAGFALDREKIAQELGFDMPARNSLDAVADRDFAVEFLAAGSLLAMHLSRLSEELVLWSSQEFGFIGLPDAFATGSSMMPQKKNPDVAELIRGRTGRVYGALVALLTILKALPLTYNRDMQEDKPALFWAADSLSDSVEVLARMLPRIEVHGAAMRAAAGGLSLATELADALVERGLPFREAHHVVGRVVASCLENERSLESLGVAELKLFSPLFDAAAASSVSVDAAVERRSLTGGTSRRRVEREIAAAEREMGATPAPSRAQARNTATAKRRASAASAADRKPRTGKAAGRRRSRS